MPSPSTAHSKDNAKVKDAVTGEQSGTGSLGRWSRQVRSVLLVRLCFMPYSSRICVPPERELRFELAAEIEHSKAPVLNR